MMTRWAGKLTPIASVLVDTRDTNTRTDGHVQHIHTAHDVELSGLDDDQVGGQVDAHRQRTSRH